MSMVLTVDIATVLGLPITKPCRYVLNYKQVLLLTSFVVKSCCHLYKFTSKKKIVAQIIRFFSKCKQTWNLNHVDRALVLSEAT